MAVGDNEALAGIREVHDLIDQQGRELATAFREGIHELSGKIEDFMQSTQKIATDQAQINGDHSARLKTLEDNAGWARVESLVRGTIGGILGGSGVVGLLSALGFIHR